MDSDVERENKSQLHYYILDLHNNNNIRDAKKYAEELDLQLWLNFPNPLAVTNDKEVEAKKVKQAIYKAHQQEIQSTVSEERWQGKLIKNRWDDEKVKLEECFA